MQSTDSVDYININLLNRIRIMQMQPFSLTFEVHRQLTGTVCAPPEFGGNNVGFSRGQTLNVFTNIFELA